MGLVNILVVENDVFIGDDLADELKGLGYSVFGPVATGKEALEVFASERLDLVVMDIELDGPMDGTQVAAIMKERAPISIIYLSDHFDPITTSKAKATRPDAYLAKPYTKINLTLQIEIALQRRADQMWEGVEHEEATHDMALVMNDRIFLRNKDSFDRVLFENLCYVEADRSYCKVITETGKHMLSLSLGNFSPELPDPPFVRIHRSYVVNALKIEAFRGNLVKINGVELQVGKTFRDAVKERFRFL